ncbi:MAG: hypothetical protein M3262_04680 [Actinomycetota bacterium]|nr:hypothetical protein [Actinomycetota bacterium]
MTPDEVGEIGDLAVATVLNGEESRRSRRLQHDVLAVHSKEITLLPRSSTNRQRPDGPLLHHAR